MWRLLRLPITFPLSVKMYVYVKHNVNFVIEFEHTVDIHSILGIDFVQYMCTYARTYARTHAHTHTHTHTHVHTHTHTCAHTHNTCTHTHTHTHTHTLFTNNMTCVHICTMQAVAIEILSSLLIKEVENAASSNVSFSYFWRLSSCYSDILCLNFRGSILRNHQFLVTHYLQMCCLPDQEISSLSWTQRSTHAIYNYVDSLNQP